MSPVAGILPVVPTPFADDDVRSIDLEGIDRVVAEQLAFGVAGVVALGIASESEALAEPERDDVLRQVRAATPHDRALVCGISGSTAVAVGRAVRAGRLGADALMVLPPPGATGEDEVARHLEEIANAVDLPLILQDAPQATGLTMAAEGQAALVARVPGVTALKLEGPDALEKIAALGPRVATVSGWGGLDYPEARDLGAVGCFPGCDLGPAFAQLQQEPARDGRDRLYRAFLPLLLYEARGLELLIAGCKHLLQRRGTIDFAGTRPPLRALTRHERSDLDALAERLAGDGVPGF